MYNVIFSMLDIRENLTEEQENDFRKQIDFVRPLPESRKVDNRIMYQANVKNIEQLREIETQLKQLDDPKIIWIWEENGLQQGYSWRINLDEFWIEESREVVRITIITEENWEQEIEIYHTFNLEQYTYYLNDIVTYDENMQETSRRRPTEEEAQNTQVNRFAWSPERDLNVY